MGGRVAVFNIVQGATLPWMQFLLDGVEATDFLSMELEVRTVDGTLLDIKTAVVDDPGVPASSIPLAIHFEWAPGDTDQHGHYHADLVMTVIAGEVLKIPERSPILIMVRGKI